MAPCDCRLVCYGDPGVNIFVVIALGFVLASQPNMADASSLHYENSS